MKVKVTLKSGVIKEYNTTNSAFKGIVTKAIKQHDSEKEKYKTQGVIDLQHAKRLKEIYDQVCNESTDTEMDLAQRIRKCLCDNTEELLFPRSEYYSRFEGTTFLKMDDPKFYATYHRSQKTRFFTEVGGRKIAQFFTKIINHGRKDHAFAAHTGGYASPFNSKQYREVFVQNKELSANTVNIHDELLNYRNQMAKVVVESFSQTAINKRHQMYTLSRPIVYAENDYPCVLVQLPISNYRVFQENDIIKYWEEHSKPMQNLFLCCFTAMLNFAAMEYNIPIEMVLRSSFSHNTPSVCETEKTFRINVGIVPECYAQLVGETLAKLNMALFSINNEQSSKLQFHQDFLIKIRRYNALKLKKAIEEHKLYKDLIHSRDFIKAINSDQAFARLYSAFCEINQQQKTREGTGTFIPIPLCSGVTVWQILHKPGNSMGKSLLSELFRKNVTKEWFVNELMKALINKVAYPIEHALINLMNQLIFNDDTVTLNYDNIVKETQSFKLRFSASDFSKLYANDSNFAYITKLLSDGLGLNNTPQDNLYANLERGCTELLSKYNVNGGLHKQSAFDFGSDSEFSDDLTNADTQEKIHISHRKIRVCSGMKAILLSYYGALYYLKSRGYQTFGTDIEQMYYEVADALKHVDKQDLALNNVRADASKILFFDLNHCNALNNDGNISLSEKIMDYNPAVVILDYTSSTYEQIDKAIIECFANQHVELVIFVTSGLKNGQAGADLNPYGEARVIARKSDTMLEIRRHMENGLSEEDKLSPETHEAVRVCKRRGFETSFFGHYKSNESRFKSINNKFEKNNESNPETVKNSYFCQ